MAFRIVEFFDSNVTLPESLRCQALREFGVDLVGRKFKLREFV